MGVRIAFDVGSVRIGVATSDPHGILASPQQVIPAGPGSIAQAVALIEEMQAVSAIVGLPKTLHNKESRSSIAAREWAGLLTKYSTVEVILVDERNTTIQAQRALHDSGSSIKKSRMKIDSAAAAVLLQSHLDWRRNREES